MENKKDALYSDEQAKEMISALDRIRNFFITLFYIGIVLINYIVTPSVLWYPWVLLFFVLYTAYHLIYPLSVSGFLGKKLTETAMQKLKKEVDAREEYYAQVRAGKI